MYATLIQAPRNEPITLAEARQWLREDNCDEDLTLQSLIVSARMTLEAFTRRFFVEQRWRLTYDSWPETVASVNTIAIPLFPCLSIDAIRVFDISNFPTSIQSGQFQLRTSSDAAQVVFDARPASPGRAHDGIEIDISVGYGAEPLKTPEPLRHAILILVANWRNHRGDGPETILPEPVIRLATPFRRERLI